MTEENETGWTMQGPDYLRWAERIFRAAPQKDIDLMNREECREHVDEMAEMLELDADLLWENFTVFSEPLWNVEFETAREMRERDDGSVEVQVGVSPPSDR